TAKWRYNPPALPEPAFPHFFAASIGAWPRGRGAGGPSAACDLSLTPERFAAPNLSPGAQERPRIRDPDRRRTQAAYRLSLVQAKDTRQFNRSDRRLNAGGWGI